MLQACCCVTCYLSCNQASGFKLSDWTKTAPTPAEKPFSGLPGLLSTVISPTSPASQQFFCAEEGTGQSFVPHLGSSHGSVSSLRPSPDTGGALCAQYSLMQYADDIQLYFSSKPGQMKIFIFLWLSVWSTSPLSENHPLTDWNSFRMVQPGLWPGWASQVFFFLLPPWLAVNFRIHFNIPVITYWTIHGWAPAYISNLLFPHVAGGSLRCIASGLTCCPLH